MKVALLLFFAIVCVAHQESINFSNLFVNNQHARNQYIAPRAHPFASNVELMHVIAKDPFGLSQSAYITSFSAAAPRSIKQNQHLTQHFSSNTRATVRSAHGSSDIAISYAADVYLGYLVVNTDMGVTQG